MHPDNRYYYRESDYGYYSTSSLYFNGATRSRTITLYIENDMVVENQFEFFSIYLWNYYSDSAVMLDPATARVTIEDDDSELSAFCKRFACEGV